MDKNQLICSQKQATTQIGFTSSEFQDSLDGEFKDSVNEIAIEKIREYRGRCIGSGYVVPNTVKLVERGVYLST